MSRSPAIRTCTAIRFSWMRFPGMGSGSWTTTGPVRSPTTTFVTTPLSSHWSRALLPAPSATLSRTSRRVGSRRIPIACQILQPPGGAGVQVGRRLPSSGRGFSGRPSPRTPPAFKRWRWQRCRSQSGLREQNARHSPTNVLNQLDLIAVSSPKTLIVGSLNDFEGGQEMCVVDATGIRSLHDVTGSARHRTFLGVLRIGECPQLQQREGHLGAGPAAANRIGDVRPIEADYEVSVVELSGAERPNTHTYIWLVAASNHIVGGRRARGRPVGDLDGCGSGEVSHQRACRWSNSIGT